MQVLEDPNKMQELAMRLRTEGKLIALVSTSGALHEGHAELIRRARGEADVVVVSAIVNPLEFGPSEDFQRYPRSSAEDADFCEAEEVDILFRPQPKHLYPEGFSFSVTEDTISKGLCGISRPHYFNGVCTLHAMLFNVVRPDHLILGQRDAQKVAVLRKMTEELRYPVTLVVVPTARNADGLPFNARNAYMNEFQRTDAAAVYMALLEGKKLVDQGIRNVDRVMAEVTHHISLVRRLRLIYVAAVHPETMQPVRPEIKAGETLLITAAWCDEVRLVDNVLL